MKDTVVFIACMWIVAVLCMTLGCGNPPRNTYSGNVVVNRQDGQVTSIRVQFPRASEPTTIRTRAEATAAIEQMEAMVKDLKAARDSMPEQPLPGD